MVTSVHTSQHKMRQPAGQTQRNHLRNAGNPCCRRTANRATASLKRRRRRHRNRFPPSTRRPTHPGTPQCTAGYRPFRPCAGHTTRTDNRCFRYRHPESTRTRSGRPHRQLDYQSRLSHLPAPSRYHCPGFRARRRRCPGHWMRFPTLNLEELSSPCSSQSVERNMQRPSSRPAHTRTTNICPITLA